MSERLLGDISCNVVNTHILSRLGFMKCEAGAVMWGRGDLSDDPSVPEPPRVSDFELANMIDNILHDDDGNNDGYIDYPEFIRAQRGRHQAQQQHHQQQLQQQQLQQQQLQQGQMNQQQQYQAQQLQQQKQQLHQAQSHQQL